MSLLIKNGRIITAVDDYEADIYVENDTITTIGKGLTNEADSVIDAKGRFVFPGGIDPHTHFELPFGGTTASDDFETGTRAAAFGGTTTCIDFAVQKKGESTLKALEEWHKKADGKASIDYAFHMIVSDMPDERLPEIAKLCDEGVTSYKLFMAYPGVLYVDDGTLYRTFRRAGEENALICMHAENGIVIDEIVKEAKLKKQLEPKYHALTRPTRMEAEGVHRAIAIAHVAQVPLYIVHLSCADAMEQVRLARNRGERVHAETCPQYLFLDTSYYERGEEFDGAKYVMTPPLREKWNQDELWKGLRMNELQALSTDHCPFCMKDQKELGRGDFSKIPNGGPGVENRMALTWTGGVVGKRISMNRFVELTSTNAARLFGLFPRKGTIAVGSDADIVVFDPEQEETISVNNPRTHHMRCDYSCYEGFRVKGYPETVISRGKIVAHKGEWKGKAGNGKFLRRNRYTEYNV